MGRYTEKKKQSNKKWDEANLRNGSYKMPIELYENFDNYCKSMNISKNKIINELVREKLEKDGFLSEWYVVLKTMCYGVDNFML